MARMISSKRQTIKVEATSFPSSLAFRFSVRFALTILGTLAAASVAVFLDFLSSAMRFPSLTLPLVLQPVPPGVIVRGGLIAAHGHFLRDRLQECLYSGLQPACGRGRVIILKIEDRHAERFNVALQGGHLKSVRVTILIDKEDCPFDGK